MGQLVVIALAALQSQALFVRQRRIVLFEKRIVLQHLLDLLREFERGQLQQSDRLLQLRRERQVLRDA